MKKVEFPTYGKSSALIEMYLGGAFGAHAEDVNAYAASTFFAVDRIASYLGDWKEFYEAGGVVLADRYTTCLLYTSWQEGYQLHRAGERATDRTRGDPAGRGQSGRERGAPP